MTSLDKFHQVMPLVVMVCGRHRRTLQILPLTFERSVRVRVHVLNHGAEDVLLVVARLLFTIFSPNLAIRQILNYQK